MVIRLVRWAIGITLTQGFLLILLAWILDGVHLSGASAALVAGPIIAVIMCLLWPVGYWVASRFHPLLFPLLSLAVCTLAMLVAEKVVDLVDKGGLAFDSTWDALYLAIGLTIGNTILGAFFTLNDAFVYDRFVVRPLQLRYRGTKRSTEPGILFLEIDGLAEPILRSAMEQGYAPTLKRWLNEGSHTLRGWEPDLSSQTSASQAGILLGSNENIPAFRWWDKEHGQLMVSSKMKTAEALEAKLSTGNGLLKHGGGSRFNVFSGDAQDCVATFSRIGSSKGVGQFAYILYFTNPYTLFRTLSMYIADVARELWEARLQRIRHVEPRIHRGFKYALVRAATTTMMQEAALFMLISDVFRGVPSAYVTFFAYDEVAHHSGIDRTDALKVLRRLDRVLGTLERISANAPRPYKLVVLSDHGQSMGATFKQRYDQSLGDLVNSLIDSKMQVAMPANVDEGLGHVNAALAEAIRTDSRTARLARRSLQGQVHEGELAIGAEEDAAGKAVEAVPETSDVVVLASGNLGLISFPKLPGRLTFEQLCDLYEPLRSGLVNHPGVSFIMVRSETEGGLIIGNEGVYYLDHGYAVGNDPLAPFGPNAAQHLKRACGFVNAPDILAISMYDQQTGEVAAFEELVGSHGGLGGTQTHPFVCYPSDLPLDAQQEIIGAAALHGVLLSWVEHLQPSALHAPATATAE